MVTASNRKMYFDVWASDDLNGDSLGELTEATNKTTHHVDNQPGSGSFRLNRNSAELAMIGTADGVARPNLVRVRLIDGGPFDYDSENYIFAFFIEEGQDNIVAVDEEGGEIIELSGRSAEVILERAVIDWKDHFPGGGDDPYTRTTKIDGQWHFDEAIPGGSSNIGAPGGVLRVLLRNAAAQVPEPMPELTHDFQINQDSNTDPWEDLDGRFDLDVGMDLLQALQAIVQGGLWYRITPALLLRAWDNSQGVDVSGSVTIEKGVNVRQSGVREIHASPVKSRVLVKGSTKKGTLKYRWVTESDSDDDYENVDAGPIEGEIGVRQGFLDYPFSPTNARLNKAGRKYLRDRKNWHDGPPTVGVLDYAGCEAYVDYQVGDTVGISLPDMPATGVVQAIDLIENESGTIDPVITFQAEPWAGEDTRSSTVTPTSSPVGGSEWGIDAAPVSGAIPVDTGETLLIWVYPAGTVLDVNGSTPDGISAGNLFYVNGPGDFVITSPDTDSQFHYIVVSGTGNYHAGA